MTPELEKTVRSLLDLVKASHEYCSHHIECGKVTVSTMGFVKCDESRPCTCENRFWLARVAAVEAELGKAKSNG